MVCRTCQKARPPLKKNDKTMYRFPNVFGTRVGLLVVRSLKLLRREGFFGGFEVRSDEHCDFGG